MRILILGAAGQVGFELCRTLCNLGDVLAADRMRDPALGIDHAIEMDDRVQLLVALEALSPDVIINAAAYTAVDLAEDEAQIAERINHHAVAELAAYARTRRALLVHYSTDYVFAGDAREPIREDHPTGAKSVYGRSKLAGEQALQASGCDHVLLRTAWVYGVRGRNFLLTMLRVAASMPELSVVDDQIGSPTTARFLAQTTALILTRWQIASAHERAKMLGTYHAVMDGSVSWNGFARAIIEQGQALGLLDRLTPVRAISSADYPSKAPRPAYSVLDSSRLRERFSCAIPSWQQGLQQTLSELAEARRSLKTIEVRTC